MADPISPGELRGRTDPGRPPLPAHCANLDPTISLCRMPATEEAVDAWLEDVETIGKDLHGLAKHDSLTIVPALIDLG